MRVTIKKSALKRLLGMQPSKARAIRERLQRIAVDPYAKDNNVKPLTGIPNAFRLRMGDWRVSYTLDSESDVIEVFEVEPERRCIQMSGRKIAEERGPTRPTGGRTPNVAKVWFAGTDFAKSRRMELAPWGSELSLIDKPDQASFVLLTKWHYEYLVERAEVAEAVAAYNETRQEETFPAEVLDRMFNGEAPVKVWREYRGMKQQHLAIAIGISKSHLSEVESRKANLSLTTLRAAARALNVDPVMLFVLEDK